VVFGALHLRTGRRLFLARRHQRAGDFQAFQRLLHGHYRGRPVALLLDEGPSHTARGSQDLAEELGMPLLWLPKRSPQLNPLDALWGQAKDVVSANKQYATIDGQVERFLQYLNTLSHHEALHTAGVLSNEFWLKSVLSKDFC
jgi:transposase